MKWAEFELVLPLLRASPFFYELLLGFEIFTPKSLIVFE